MITAIICLPSSPGSPTWGLKISVPQKGLAWPRIADTRLGHRLQESTRLPPVPVRASIPAGALETPSNPAKAHLLPPSCGIQEEQCPKRKKNFLVTYSLLQILGKQNKIEGGGRGVELVCKVNLKFQAGRQAESQTLTIRSPQRAPWSHFVEGRLAGDEGPRAG